jgi:hypothetical protein
MGVFDKLREGIFRVRVIPKATPADETAYTSDRDSLNKRMNDAIESGKRLDLSDLLNISSLKCSRNQKYTIFEEMVTDGRIGAAVEMYANDTVQYSPEGKIVWVESSDTEVAQDGNKLLNDLQIPENLWSYAYCMWLYGDVYLELFENTSYRRNRPTLLVEPLKANPNIRTQVKISGAKLERYIEKVANPAEVYDLQYKGKTSGYIRSQDDFDSNYESNAFIYSTSVTDIDILNPTKYVHICLSPNINRHPEKFKLIKDEQEQKDEQGRIDASDSEGTGGELSFTVKTGQSVLENVYEAYQTLKLKEESVLLERLTKSSITRVVQVELGDMPEPQKRRKLQEIKNQIEQQIQMNKQAGTMQSRAGAQPTENIIYTTTKDGKGAISTVNIGGDVDIGDLSDIDDSENKLYGALLIPKALLGADMDGSGLSNGGSLTEMNTTYARRIKRGQVAIQSALKTLINIFALSDGLGDKIVNNFEVRLTPIITVEDNRRDELMQTKIRNINDIMNLFGSMESIDEETRLNMLIEWLSKYLNQQDIVDIINERLKQMEQDEIDNPDSEDTEEDAKDNKDNSFDARPSGGMGRPSSVSKLNDTNEETEETSSETDNITPNPMTDENRPQLAPQVDLADITTA